jgi:hypothetical protein
MARKLVLDGPAAEAVERLAQSAGVSPAELIRRALRREDEAQRDEVESRVNGGIGPEPGPVLPDTRTAASAVAALPAPYITPPAVSYPGVPEEVVTFPKPERSRDTGTARESRRSPLESRPEQLESFPEQPGSARSLPRDSRLMERGLAMGVRANTGARQPIGAAIPVPEGSNRYLTVEPSADGQSIRISFSGPGDPYPNEPGEHAEVPPTTVRLHRPGERG